MEGEGGREMINYLLVRNSWVRPDQSHEPRTPLEPPPWVARVQAPRPFCAAFQGALTQNWIRSGAIRTQNCSNGCWLDMHKTCSLELSLSRLLVGRCA